MKKTGLLLAASLAFTSLNAETGIFGSYVAVNANSSGDTFYGAQQPGGNFLTAFEGLDLGTFNVTEGDTLVLSGGEVLTFKNAGAGDNVTGAEIQYRINRVTAPSDIGSFSAIGINFTANASFNDAAGNNFSGGGDQKWANISSTADLLSGLDVGTVASPIEYEVEVYFRAFTSLGDRFSSDSGNNYTATFTLVPEPSAFALLAGLFGLGFVAMNRRIR